MNNNLLIPCRTMLNDKLQINPSDDIILQSIDIAQKSIPQSQNDTPSYNNKRILAYVYEQFKNNDTIENAVHQLETIRSMPVDTTTTPTPIPPLLSPTPSNPSNQSYPSYPPNSSSNSPSPVVYKPYQHTHLVTLSTSKTIAKLPKNSKCSIHCIISNMLTEDIIILNISNHNTKYKYHLYRDTGIYKTIDNINPIVISNKDICQINIQNYQGNDIQIKEEQVILEQIQKIDENHFKIITSIPDLSHDIKINQHVFYHVDTNTYVTDSHITDLSQFLNTKCNILANNINILFKYTYLQ